MRLICVLILLTGVGYNAFSQTNSKDKITGQWKLEKTIISPELFFDIGDKDSTRRNFLRQYKEKNSNSSWTYEDSSTVEMLYNKAMNEMAQMSISFEAGNKYVASAFSSVEGKVVEEKGIFKFIPGTMELTLSDERDKSNITQLKVLSLDDSILTISGKDTTKPYPILKYRKQK